MPEALPICGEPGVQPARPGDTGADGRNGTSIASEIAAFIMQEMPMGCMGVGVVVLGTGALGAEWLRIVGAQTAKRAKSLRMNCKFWGCSPCTVIYVEERVRTGANDRSLGDAHRFRKTQTHRSLPITVANGIPEPSTQCCISFWLDGKCAPAMTESSRVFCVPRVVTSSCTGAGHVADFQATIRDEYRR